MKKSVLLLLGIVIGVGVSYLYFNGGQKEENVAIVKPQGVITVAQAKALDARYATNSSFG